MVPSPKSQNHEVGEPVELSEKATWNPELLEVNAAAGAWQVMAIGWHAVSGPHAFVAVRQTLYVPGPGNT